MSTDMGSLLYLCSQQSIIYRVVLGVSNFASKSMVMFGHFQRKFDGISSSKVSLLVVLESL